MGALYRSAGINLRVKSDERGKKEDQRFDTAWRCKTADTIWRDALLNIAVMNIQCSHCGENIPFDEQCTVLTQQVFD